MRTLDVLVALFAAFMLFRHAPRALQLLRGHAQARAMAVVSLVNVLLAIGLLAFAVKGIVSRVVAR